MDNEKAVLVRGNLSDGFKFTGPFKSFTDAVVYSDDNPSDEYGEWIAEITPPPMNRWKDTRLQAVRLVVEILSTCDVDLTPARESMDLSEEDFAELTERISDEWEEIKKST
jgi:hypothetical protein